MSKDVISIVAATFHTKDSLFSPPPPPAHIPFKVNEAAGSEAMLEMLVSYCQGKGREELT